MSTTIKCPSCGYKEDQKKWSRLEISGSVNGCGNHGVLFEYDPKSDSFESRGRVYLVACPYCRTITYYGSYDHE